MNLFPAELFQIELFATIRKKIVYTEEAAQFYVTLKERICKGIEAAEASGNLGLRINVPTDNHIHTNKITSDSIA